MGAVGRMRPLVGGSAGTTGSGQGTMHDFIDGLLISGLISEMMISASLM